MVTAHHSSLQAQPLLCWVQAVIMTSREDNMLQQPSARPAPVREHPRFTPDAFAGARFSEGDMSDISLTASSHDLALEAVQDHAPASSQAGRANGTARAAAEREPLSPLPTSQAASEPPGGNAPDPSARKRSAKGAGSLRSSLQPCPLVHQL